MGKTQQTIDNREKELVNLTQVSKILKLSALFEDELLHTQQEIADAVGVPTGTIKDKMSKKEWLDLTQMLKPTKLSALFEDELLHSAGDRGCGGARKTNRNRQDK